ncbi:MAG: hypothetical protein JXQ99_10990 [Hyphomicrobiaceae bacterium]
MEHPNRSTFESASSVRALGPWDSAKSQFLVLCRKNFVWIAAVALICGFLAAAAQPFLPSVHKASAQILVDPRGFSVDSNVNIDANAAINYVESQMLLLRSDGVLLEVLRREGSLNGDKSRVKESWIARWKRALIGRGKDAVAVDSEKLKTEQLKRLRESIDVTRQGRSFVITLTTKDDLPEVAAGRANSIINVFLGTAENHRTVMASASAAAIAQKQLDVTNAELLELVGTLGAKHPTVRTAQDKVERLERKLKRFQANAKAPNGISGNDAGAISSAFLRVISPVRQPPKKGWKKRAVIWLIVGSIIGGFLALSAIAFGAVVREIRKIAVGDRV